MTDLHKKVVAVAKRVWLVVVFIAISIYFVRNAPQLLQYTQDVRPAKIIFSLGLLLVGKLALVWLSLYTVRDTTWKPSFLTMYAINAYVQNAKYLPGGIWHFVSRAGYYKLNDLSLKTTSRAMIIENIWLVLSAFFCGAILLIASLASQPLVPIIGCVAIWFVVSWIVARWTVPVARLQTFVQTLLFQIMIWIPFGLSYTILLPVALEPDIVTISAGSFIISWLIGYLTIFAPGGIGTRELVLTALMLTVLDSELSLFYATLHRLLWVSIELLLGLSALGLRSRLR